ncbi:mismatch repair endonuclease PMS2-like [Acanthaster planci]|uniref:Mismatch repair endonuclease PMS2 n=1 Tax=Acanthaster planci TaxID=133434 RepID=A0A8B7YDZ6_ACAPL|nr:mismatch repair endonuclease PMS2-like [Acanthaster planci]XP_022091475.1 mismatch repair endonuclease PMS2-like [Acanthaster planci]XP_022091476.1 mismatch repair endonuclease PMS2-like [Acanthaster planci]
MMAGSVKAIDRQSVHRICSGQVVLNLATAIKELVENALDAGATNIDIRLKEHGSDIVEVTDNGSGVEESNFQGLTLKHHTSKLRDFSDLTSVDTFGFRGEALSSLCALSDMTIVTCHKSASVGSRLEYDHNGRLIKQTLCPRQPGTTVTLQNLFSTLPVRHKEFLRHLKKEFTKMVQLLQAYGIVSSGVKLTCTNQVGKGKRSPVLSTSGNALLKENIANVFGPKQLQSLLEFSQTSPNAEQCEEYGITEHQLQDKLFKLTGYISKSDHGQGRSSSDRQYYYINKRPCDFAKVSKLVNEVYHMYNRHQYPFVVLDISLAKESVDVNVTPDKRKIFVLEEKSLLAMLKASLQLMFEPRSALYDLNSQIKSSLGTNRGKTETGGVSSPIIRPSLSTGATPEGCQPDYRGLKGTLAGLKRSFSHAGSSADSSCKEAEPRPSKQPRLDAFLLKRSVTAPARTSQSLPSTLQNHTSETHQLTRTSEDNSSQCEENFTEVTTDEDTCVGKVAQTDKKYESDGDPNESINEQLSTDLRSRIETNTKGFSDPTECGEISLTLPTTNSLSEEISPDSDLKQDGSPTLDSNLEKVSEKHVDRIQTASSDTKHDELQGNHIGAILQNETSSPTSGEENVGLPVKTEDERTTSDETRSQQRVIVMDDSSFQATTSRREVRVPFSMDMLSSRLKEKQDSQGSPRALNRTFKAVITPADNSTAEEELKKHVSKDMFPCMQILGQFNLGFIIAKYDRDLFIIDQHATDEKYNFEMLQRHTVLQGQKLIQPMALELTAVSESVLIDNLEIFRKNGFDFNVDPEATPTQRVKLTSLPMSKNWTFGKEDIDEVIFMLSDSPGVMCRPSRVRQMFASRACRKSIMIGTALDKREMRKLVNHMAEIEQPWNCPHGRPTMRHLFNLDMLPD